MTQSLISIRGLEVRYNNSFKALKNVNLELYHGEFAIVLGSSGAGKSTLLRAINCLVPHSAGEIVSSSLGVIDPKQASLLRAFRRDIAMVFQQHQLIDRLTALDNVLMGRLGFHPSFRSLFPLPAADQDWALSCLDRVGLLNKALEKVRNLSGGQQQRVGIARALAQEPKIILADEPIASLDPKSSNQILTLMKDICMRDGIAALLSLHQVEFAKQYGDRILGLSGGSICCDNSPDQIGDYEIELIYQTLQDVVVG